MLLDSIQHINDIKKIDPKDYPALAAEIRRFLLEKVSKTGGHLSANLGVVELTMALHLVLDLPKDKLIFDVGHQCYTHKLLTGRRDGFDTLRQDGGMSGFPKTAESECDLFDTGHSSTSISMGLGLAQARELSGENYTVVSVIGDGSMTGGMAFEALNNATELKGNFIIVLNDNGKSIGDNVGGMSGAFQNLRTAPRYNRIKQSVKNTLDRIPSVGNSMVRTIGKAKDAVKQLLLPSMVFEDMGLTYLGPIDGHNVKAMVKAFEAAKRLDRAVIVHVVTTKGKGYRFAEEDPERFHGIGPFDIITGKELRKKDKSYTEYASEGLLSLGDKDERVVGITAAMAGGTGLSAFQKRYPDRFFDVGIAEQHAVSFASGLAKGGYKPYVCIYSTFLQRAYDQIVHDVALQDAKVTFLIDRAGLVGADGATHHGMLDAGFLQTVPGLTLMSPRDGEELKEMLEFSLHFAGPLAIRYPRGAAPETLYTQRSPLVYGQAEILEEGCDILIFAMGAMVKAAKAACEKLRSEGLTPTLVNGRFAKPFDKQLLRALSGSHKVLVVLEENNKSGALGEQIAEFCEEETLAYRLLNLAAEDAFYPHGSETKLKETLEWDPDGICRRIRETVQEINA